MELDLDALGESTLDVRLGKKIVTVKQITLAEYIRALAVREASGGDSVESTADVLRKMVESLAPGSFGAEELVGLTAKQLTTLVKKLDQFQSGVEGDGGNPAPGAV